MDGSSCIRQKSFPAAIGFSRAIATYSAVVCIKFCITFHVFISMLMSNQVNTFSPCECPI